MTSPTITRLKDGIEVSTSYNKQFVDLLKSSIPQSKRVWSKPNWIVAKEYEFTVVGFIIICYGVQPRLVDNTHLPDKRIQKTIKVEYLGACKEKDGGVSSASAYVDGSWSVLILESALRDYFEGEKQNSDSGQTHYTTLGIKQNSTPEEVKKAYRQLAKQWHPDINKDDPDASEKFKSINAANEILGNDLKRRKYDFMLDIMNKTNEIDTVKSVHKHMSRLNNSLYGYRSPLLCGHIDVEGTVSFGRLVVDKINAWDEITNDQGKTMVVTWKYGDSMFTVHWV